MATKEARSRVGGVVSLIRFKLRLRLRLRFSRYLEGENDPQRERKKERWRRSRDGLESPRLFSLRAFLFFEVTCNFQSTLRHQQKFIMEREKSERERSVRMSGRALFLRH